MSGIKNLNVNYDKLSEEKKRDLYLRRLATGEIQGPPTGKASQDKPWLKYYPEEAIIVDVPDVSIYEYLYNSIKDYPDDILIEYFGRKITAKEVLDNIDKLADRFKEQGIKRGEYVAIALANSPESVYCIYALNKIGAIPCNIDPRENEDDLARDIITANAKHYIGVDLTYSKIKKISKKYKLNTISIVSPFESAPNTILLNGIKVFYNFKNFLKGNYVLKKDYKYSKKMVNLDIDGISNDDDTNQNLAVVVHTGGTTGVHKGVRISNYAINETVGQHKYLMDNVGPGSTIYNPLPQFMAYGMTTMHLSLCNRLHMYMVAASSPKTFGKEIKNLNPEIIYGGPIHYQQGRKSKKLQNARITTKIAVSGGEKVSLSEEQNNNDFYCGIGLQDEIYNGYGASEVCGVFSVKRGRKNSAGSVGLPFPKNNIKIIDEETNEEIDYFSGKSGEIYIKGPSMMLGYDDKCETAKVIKDGWFQTGDIGYMNQNGELFITGRKKRQFVSGVNKVYIPDVEEKIESFPMVEKCVVVGVEDENLRTVPWAYVNLSEEYKNKGLEESIKEEIIKKLKDVLPDTSIPVNFIFDTKFKYTPNGKIDFLEMEKEANQILKNEKALVRKRY